MLSSLDKLSPHSYNILPPLAAGRIHHFTPSKKITPSLLPHFTPLGSLTLRSCYPPLTNKPLTLKMFYPPWQPISNLSLPPLDKLPPHSDPILTPLAGQLLDQVTPP